MKVSHKQESKKVLWATACFLGILVASVIAIAAETEIISSGDVIIDADSDSNGTNKIQFTHHDGTALVTIEEDGDLGIGTTSPAYDLDVVNSTTARIRTKGDGGSYAAGWMLEDSSTGDNWQLYMVDDQTAASQRMTVVFNDVSEETHVTAMAFTEDNVVVGGSFDTSMKLHVYDADDDNYILRLQDTDGTCDAHPESGSLTWSCSSDRRMKDGIRDTNSALKYFEGIRVRDYSTKATGKELTGVVAQEIAEIHPEMVRKNTTTGMSMVSPPNQWKLVKAIQELQEQNETLKKMLCDEFPEKKICKK
ncbi:MAG: tail fiber domain-containing protein [Deltaproteobacteria bacterium]|nr:tail fiber domain-containing protein [Deltaproteobacteria bacterium]